MRNGTMLQGFQWELPDDGTLWRQLRRMAFRLRRQGFTALWLPPAYKGTGGKGDVGYGVYDLFDLGEFDQKNTVRTKYGTKAEYLDALKTLKAADIQALPDVVLNHRMGADERERVKVLREDPERRNLENPPEREADIFTRFTFPGRRGKYSDFVWDHRCFTGVDWDDLAKEKGLYRIKGKEWKTDVDQEKGNYDYLMGADVDVGSPEVLAELRRWGHWYADTTGCDGFRLDAVKHISASFYREWLAEMRAYTGREMFAVGEYWHYDVGALLWYLDQVDHSMSLFDVPLHHHLKEASCGRLDMRELFAGTLVGCCPLEAVTFVDNHDTQPGQSLESWVDGWFKAAAYGLILLRAEGYPCVFWGDLYGIPGRGIGAVTELSTMMRLRRTHAYGEEHDYFDHPNIVGFTREGEKEESGSGLAFLCTNGEGGKKEMYVGRQFAGRTFLCVLGDQREVRVDWEGKGVFAVGEKGASVYVPAPTGEEIVRQARTELVRLVEGGKRQAIWLGKTLLERGNGSNG